MTESEVLEVRIGDEHITPEQIMDVNIGTYGPGDYVLPTGQKLEAQLLSNNSIRIFDGAMVYCGVRDVIAVNNYHDVTIENGQQGMNRNDIIVRHFAKNEETQFGGAEFQVIKGTATSGDATDPEITDTDLRAGALTHDMKIYRARLEGLNVVAVEPLFEVLPSIPELNGKMTGAFTASDIQSAVASGVRGGWKQIGDIVFVDVKFNLVNSYKDAVIMKNLPVPRNDRSILAAANISASRGAYGIITLAGDLEWHDSAQPATGNECSISGIYNCI